MSAAWKTLDDWLTSCLEKGFSPPHDPEEIRLLEKYYAGITEGYLYSVAEQLGLDYMEWWASSSSMLDNPLQTIVAQDKRSLKRIILTPIEIAEHARSVEARNRAAVEEMRTEYGLGFFPVSNSPINIAGGSQSPSFESLQESRGRQPTAPAAEVFLPTGFRSALDTYARNNSSLVEVPVDANIINSTLGQLSLPQSRSDRSTDAVTSLVTPTIDPFFRAHELATNGTPYETSSQFMTMVFDQFIDLSPDEHAHISFINSSDRAALEAGVVQSFPKSTIAAAQVEPSTMGVQWFNDADQGAVKYDMPTASYQQFFLHGVASDSSAMSPRYVESLGGDPNNRLDWRSNQSFLLRSVFDDVPFVPTSFLPSMEMEADRLADEVASRWNPAGGDVLLHGHSAGGVMSEMLIPRLEQRGVHVAGIVEYGSPNALFDPVQHPVDSTVPILRVESDADFVLAGDRLFNALPLDNQEEVARLSHDRPYVPTEHFFSDYEGNPITFDRVQNFAERIRGACGQPSYCSPDGRQDGARWTQQDYMAAMQSSASGLPGVLVGRGVALPVYPQQAAPGDVVQVYRRDPNGSWIGVTGFVSNVRHANGRSAATVYTVDQGIGVVGETPFYLDLQRGPVLVARPSITLTHGQSSNQERHGASDLDWKTK